MFITNWIEASWLQKMMYVTCRKTVFFDTSVLMSWISTIRKGPPKNNISMKSLTEFHSLECWAAYQRRSTGCLHGFLISYQNLINLTCSEWCSLSFTRYYLFKLAAEMAAGRSFGRKKLSDISWGRDGMRSGFYLGVSVNKLVVEAFHWTQMGRELGSHDRREISSSSRRILVAMK
jgi:hypothetical protein